MVNPGLQHDRRRRPSTATTQPATPATDTGGTSWRSLSRIGGFAACALAGIVVVQFFVFVLAPPPIDGSALDWFVHFQDNRLLGLLGFELLMVVYVILSIPLTLALFVRLRDASPTLTALYLALSLIGVIAFIAARPALEMLSLSDRHAAATSDAERQALAAAGETLVAAFHGTAFHTSYLLGSLGGALLAAAMLRDGGFGRTIPLLRLASSALDLGLYLPVVGLSLSAGSAIVLLVWNILVARRLLHLSRA